MRKLMYLSIFFILVMSLLVAGPSSPVFASRLNAISPTLGAAESYSVLAGSIVTNTGPSTIAGDVGVSPSIGVPPHVTGFPPGIVGPPGTVHDADAHAAAAQAANTAAFGALDQTCTVDWSGTGLVDLVGMNLVPGVYCADQFSLSGTLTLSESGVWIFKSASDFVTSGTANVVGGNALDVWWRVVSSATLGSYTSLIGNILASTSIWLRTGASLNGRALAQTGEVTLDSNTIFGPICLAKQTATATVTETTTPTVTPTGTFVPPTATATDLPVVTALPPTGGAPLQNDGTSWGLLIAGGLSALTLLLGVRTYRKSAKSKL